MYIYIYVYIYIYLFIYLLIYLYTQLYITLPGPQIDEGPGEGLVHRLEPLGVTLQRMVASAKIHVFLKTQIEHDVTP